MRTNGKGFANLPLKRRSSCSSVTPYILSSHTPPPSSSMILYCNVILSYGPPATRIGLPSIFIRNTQKNLPVKRSKISIRYLYFPGEGGSNSSTMFECWGSRKIQDSGSAQRQKGDEEENGRAEPMEWTADNSTRNSDRAPWSSCGSFAERLAARGNSAAMDRPNTARFKSMPPSRLPIPRSNCLKIPPGLSPTTLLDSPVLLSTSQLCADGEGYWFHSQRAMVASNPFERRTGLGFYALGAIMMLCLLWHIRQKLISRDALPFVAYTA